MYAGQSPSSTRFQLTTTPPLPFVDWYSRHRLFSQYDSGILLDRESWFSVTPEAIAARIAERCRCNVVVDLFCGAGGNAIQFAFTCEKVIAVDVDPVKIEMARHNAGIYGVQDRITFLVGDAVEFCKDVVAARDAKAKGTTSASSSKWQGAEQEDIDVVFLSPPWGGTGYEKAQGHAEAAASPPPAPLPASILDESFDSAALPTSFATPAMLHKQATVATPRRYAYYPLSALSPLSGQDLYAMAAKITPDVAMFLPRSCDLDELAKLPLKAGEEEEADSAPVMSIEEQFLGKSFKALSVYFGSLATDWSEGEGGQ